MAIERLLSALTTYSCLQKIHDHLGTFTNSFDSLQFNGFNVLVVGDGNEVLKLLTICILTFNNAGTAVEKDWRYNDCTFCAVSR